MERKIGINLTLQQRIQETFVGHQDPTRASFTHHQQSIDMLCHNWTRQTLSDAREPTNLENWFGGLVPMRLVACDDSTNKIGNSLANDKPRIEVDEEDHS